MKNLYTFKTSNFRLILQLVLGVLLSLSASYHSYSQVKVDFDPRASVYTPNKTIYNVKGDFTMIGNTNLTLVNYDDDENNGGNDMKYVDVDNDPNTLNSSSATLQLSEENGANPECSNIVYAGLYWTGRAGSSNTFTVTKNVPTGNTTTQQTTSSESIFDNDNIPHTNYSLDISSSNGTYTFTFTSSGSGNKVAFIYRTSGSNKTVKVSINDGPEQNVSMSSVSDYNAYFTTPYQIFSDSNYTLKVSRLRLQNADRAYVDITYNETVPETIQVTKTYNKHKISIKGPNATSYTQLTAADNEIYYPSGVDDNMYSAYTEVTDYVRANGLGNYFVADIALKEGDPDGTGYYGGWGMVVVYENSKMKWRDVTVFDGHAYVVSTNNNAYTIDVNGFNATQSGPVNVKLGMMAGEGDVAFTGDNFQIEKRNSGTYSTLAPTSDYTNNFFHSAIETGGNPRNPMLKNNTGMDISMFNLNNADKSLIDNNQNSTSFRYYTDGDTYAIFNVTFSVDAYIPESEGLLSVSNIAGNTPTGGQLVAQPGDQIEYGLEIRNKGTEAIQNAKLVIPIPFTSEFVAGSITYGEYHNLFNATAPYYDANEGATGAIVWDIAYLPLNSADINMLLADIHFKLKTTEDCAILVNNNCAPKIVILGGNISGTGVVSGIHYNLPLIQGYQENGICQGEPNTDPIEIDIDSEQYILEHCTGVSIQRDFFYCSFEGNTIPVSEVEAQFPPGSLFYDSYPVTASTIQYTDSNPFPATLGVSTYYAIPPGNTTCNYIFTIEVNAITSSPQVDNVSYCLNETASPLTAQTTNPNYTLLYYTDNNPDTVGQTSLIPDTSVAGVFTYYVAEGPTNGCVNTDRTPITVTVYDTLTITLNNKEGNLCPNATDGSIDISVSGGSGSYTYDWDNNGLQDPDSDPEDLTNLANGTYTVIVSDANSNCTATATFNIITLDTTAPTITAPNGITVNGCTTNDITNGNLTALAYNETTTTISESEFLAEGGTFSEDNVASITYSDSSTGTCPIIVTRTYTITDSCGQNAQSSQTITIANTTPPTISAPANTTVECNESTEPAATGTATGNDSCGSVTITYTDATTAACGNTQTITRTWTATDDCGNTASAEQTISVVDTTAPSISAPANTTVECNESTEPAATGTATGSDSCGSVTITYTDATIAACGNTQTITRTWTATDDCGNTASAEQTISVVDTTAPSIDVQATNISVECDGQGNTGAIEAWLNSNGGASASDSCSTNLTWTNNYNGAASDCTNSIEVTFTVTDECGNSAITTASYAIQDTTAPEITQASNLTVECDGNGNLTQLQTWLDNHGGATATDDCSSVTWSNNFNGLTDGCGNTGNAEVTFTATDGCGNTSTTTATFTIIDTNSPPITRPADDITVECDGNGNLAELQAWLDNHGGATAFDTCSEITWTNNFNGLTTTCGNTASATVLFTVTDECGLSSSSSGVFTIIDTTAPTF
ncbi:MAG: hypothetical protein R2812_11950, partial [Gelidibacter sp.]